MNNTILNKIIIFISVFDIFQTTKKMLKVLIPFLKHDTSTSAKALNSKYSETMTYSVQLHYITYFLILTIFLYLSFCEIRCIISRSNFYNVKSRTKQTTYISKYSTTKFFSIRPMIINERCLIARIVIC